MINQKIIKNNLNYNPDTGLFCWKINKRGGVKIGDIAGRLMPDGYIRITLNQKQYPAHVLAFIYVHNYCPQQIHHINHIRNDNRIVNLQASNYSHNNRRRLMLRNNTTGHTGIIYHKRDKAYIASIYDNNNKRIYKYFKIIEDAIAWRKIKEVELGYE